MGVGGLFSFAIAVPSITGAKSVNANAEPLHCEIMHMKRGKKRVLEPDPLNVISDPWT